MSAHRSTRSKRIIIGAAMAGVAGLLGVAAAANAADVDAQEATCSVGTGSGRACVAIDNGVGGQAKSVRVNGQCLIFSGTGQYQYFPKVTVPATDNTPTLLTYSGNACQSNTQTSTNVSWDGSPGNGNFRYVHIKEFSHGDCGRSVADLGLECIL